ncbi:hypothetical protein, partial [Caldibacillus debilis]|uniref:hypothetical protein n=1 Tax=Caldibacillus debilis TaxID=301148 RepID=UPI0023F563D7
MTRARMILLVLWGIVLVVAGYVVVEKARDAHVKATWYAEYLAIEKSPEKLDEMTYTGEVVSVKGDKVTVRISQAKEKSLVGKEKDFYLNDHSHIQYGVSAQVEKGVIKKGALVHVLAYKDMIHMIHV